MAQLIDARASVKAHFAECEPQSEVYRDAERQCDECGAHMTLIQLRCEHGGLLRSYTCETDGPQRQYGGWGG
jgi:hypothetical protein